MNKLDYLINRENQSNTILNNPSNISTWELNKYLDEENQIKEEEEKNKALEKIKLERRNLKLKSNEELLKDSISVPNVSDIFDNNQIDKYNQFSIATDFALINGINIIKLFNIFDQDGYISSYFVQNGSLDGVSVTSSTDVGTSYVSKKQPERIDNGIRPIIRNADLIIEKNSLNVFTYDNISMVNIGEYPQSVIEEEKAKHLINLYTSGKLEKTGKKYAYNKSLESHDNLCNVGYHDEYCYDAKKYIFVKLNLPENRHNGYGYGKVFLSNKYEYKNGDLICIEVKPVTWIYDSKTNTLLSKNILLSGINYNPTNTKDFSQTNIYKFLSNYMVNDLFNIKKINIKDYEENIKRFIKEYPNEAQNLLIELLVENGLSEDILKENIKNKSKYSDVSSKEKKIIKK